MVTSNPNLSPVGERALEELRSGGSGNGLQFLLAAQPSGGASPDHPDHPLAQLFAVERCPDLTSRIEWPLITYLDESLALVQQNSERYSGWLSEQLRKVWSEDWGAATGSLAELEALGTIQRAFPGCVPIRETKTQTPGFHVEGAFTLEVYCPLVSKQDRRQVERDLARQDGNVRVALSHPHTGSGGQALVYPASKVIDRIVNAKRSSKQFQSGRASILYIDGRRQWQLSAEDVLPFRTKYSLETHWVGTKGVWHAFYGAEGMRTLLPHRVSLDHLNTTDAHEQVQRGLLRATPQWSACILALMDGLALFENPWAEEPLHEKTLRRILQMSRMRAEFSWYRGPDAGAFEAEVERMLQKLEWTFAGLYTLGCEEDD